MLELVALPQQKKFGEDKRDTLTQFCMDCDVRFACNGGCPKDRFATSPYGEPGQHYLCSGYKAFFHHVQDSMQAMAQLLREGRAPADLMAVYAAEDARRPRNSACSCGSARKWKHCHGAPRHSDPGSLRAVPNPR
jgi:uncharacterized protein